MGDNLQRQTWIYTNSLALGQSSTPALFCNTSLGKGLKESQLALPHLPYRGSLVQGKNPELRIVSPECGSSSTS